MKEVITLKKGDIILKRGKLSMMAAKLFGSESSERVLLFLACYGQGYPSKISETFQMPVSQVQRQLLKLETEGILVSHLQGRTRVFQWNPRCVFVEELQALLKKILFALPDAIQERYFRNRTRPRRTGKPL